MVILVAVPLDQAFVVVEEIEASTKRVEISHPSRRESHALEGVL